MKGQNKLFIAIIIALILGVGIGGLVHVKYPESAEPFSKNIKCWELFHQACTDDYCTFGFTTLVVGIAKMSDIKMIGRVGTKAMLWFISASCFPFHRIGACELAGTGTRYQTSDSGCSFCRRILKSSKGFSWKIL
jgi:Na+/H+-dicarboxylate symporter